MHHTPEAGLLMIAFATLVVGSGLVINVADTVPRYDLKPTCRAAVNLAAGTEGRTIESCMAGEDAAQKIGHAHRHLAGGIQPFRWHHDLSCSKRRIAKDDEPRGLQYGAVAPTMSDSDLR